MAIASTVDQLDSGLFRVRCHLTAQTSTSTETISDVPAYGRIIRRTITLVSGTGTTIDPVLHRSATIPAATNAEDVIEHPLETSATYTGSATTPAANVGGTSETPYYAPESTWYLTVQANNATADHVVVAEYLIRAF